MGVYEMDHANTKSLPDSRCGNLRQGEWGRARTGVRWREGEDYTTLSQQKVMVPFQRTGEILLKGTANPFGPW